MDSNGNPLTSEICHFLGAQRGPVISGLPKPCLRLTYVSERIKNHFHVGAWVPEHGDAISLAAIRTTRLAAWSLLKGLEINILAFQTTQVDLFAVFRFS